MANILNPIGTDRSEKRKAKSADKASDALLAKRRLEMQKAGFKAAIDNRKSLLTLNEETEQDRLNSSLL